MNKLSIWIPSHADFQSSKKTIGEAYELSLQERFEIVVSDNSRDPAKAEHWGSLKGEHFKYFISPFDGSWQNAENALLSTTGEWACFLSDDDQLTLLPEFDINSLETPLDVVGIRPAMALYTKSLGLYKFTNFAINSDKAKERVQFYMDNHGGANTTLFSLYRSNIYKSLLSEVIAYHPTKGGYNDWAVVLALISSGKVEYNPNILYIYNNKNWSNSKDIDSNTKKTFTDVGMAPDNKDILLAHLALDSFFFICRNNSPIAFHEKVEAAEYVFDRFFWNFCNQLISEASSDSIMGERLEKCIKLTSWASNTAQRIASLLAIIDEWNPGLSKRYIDFIGKTVDPGVIDLVLLGQPSDSGDIVDVSTVTSAMGA